MTLIIDSEFQSLIPPLAPDELAQLEASLLDEGCRDALVVWAGENILVDGHNRYAICQKHGIEYRTVEREFESRADVEVWMIGNQLARRNIPPFVRGELVLRMKAVIESKAKAQQVSGLKQGEEPPVLLNSTKREPIHTRKELAKAAETSEDTIRKVEHVTKGAPEPIKQAARLGDISTHRAYQITQQLEKLPTEHHDRVASLCDDSLEKYTTMVRLHKSMGSPETNGTYEEIVRTSGFHYGKDMEKWLDFEKATMQEVTKALDSVAGHHASEGLKTSPAKNAPILSSESNEWYTPPEYIEAARHVMGSIDVDPASNPKANETVKAVAYFTKEQDGLKHQWPGNIWLNPPYGRDIPGQFVDYLIRQYEAGTTKQAILLVNLNSATTQWFAPLWNYTVCIPKGRINFTAPEESENGSTHGSVFVYLGDKPEVFADVFKQFGPVVKRIDL